MLMFKVYVVNIILYGCAIPGYCQTFSVSKNPVQLGTSASFTCNPNAAQFTGQLDWNRGSTTGGLGSIMSLIPYTDGRCDLYPQHDFSNNYTFTCGTDIPPVESILTIPAVNMTEDEHGSRWRCTYNFGDIGTTITLSVLVPVSSATLTSTATQNTEVTINTGDTTQFTCVTDACRPQARIEWFRDGVNITDNPGVNSDLTAVDVTGPKVTTTSTLYFTGAANDGNTTIKCKTVNIEGQTPVESTKLKLIVTSPPSDDPVISGYTQDTPLYEDDDLLLTCTQSGGNPPPFLTWSGACTRGTSNYSISGTTVTHMYRVRVNRNMNGQMCTCISTHSTYAEDKVEHVLLTIYFAPDVQITTTNSSEGTTVQLHCSTVSMPPNADIVGWKHILNSKVVRETDSFPNISPDKSILTLDPVSYQDAGLYICIASNGVPKGGITDQTGSTFFSVQVGANFLCMDTNKSPTQTRFYARLYQHLNVSIPFYSVPNDIELEDISWIHMTGSIKVSHSPIIQLYFENIFLICDFYGNPIQRPGHSATMIIKQFTMHHAGHYTLEVKRSSNIYRFQFDVMLAGPPERPIEFKYLRVTSDSITIFWIRGKNGGDKQTFVIVITETNTNKEDIVEIIENSYNSYSYTAAGLKPSTLYKIHLYAYNQEGNSTRFNDTDLEIYTLVPDQQCETKCGNVSNIAAGVIGTVCTAFVIGVTTLIVVLFIRANKRNTDGNKINESSAYDGVDTQRVAVNSYDEINIDSALNAVQGRSSAYEATDVSMVSKNIYDDLEPNRDLQNPAYLNTPI